MCIIFICQLHFNNDGGEKSLSEPSHKKNVKRQRHQPLVCPSSSAFCTLWRWNVPELPSIPGGLGCTSNVSYLVPSCCCQAVSHEGLEKSRCKEVFCRQIQGTYCDPIFSWFLWHFEVPYRPPTPIADLKHRTRHPCVLPSFSMPTFKHFMKRQAWQDLRLRFVISHSFVAGQLYSMLPKTQGLEKRSCQICKT